MNAMGRCNNCTKNTNYICKDGIEGFPNNFSCSHQVPYHNGYTPITPPAPREKVHKVVDANNLSRVLKYSSLP